MTCCLKVWGCGGTEVVDRALAAQGKSREDRDAAIRRARTVSTLNAHNSPWIFSLNGRRLIKLNLRTMTLIANFCSERRLEVEDTDSSDNGKLVGYEWAKEIQIDTATGYVLEHFPS